MSRKNNPYILPPNDANLKYFLGQFTLGITNNIVPPNWTKCSYKFINEHVLFLEFYNNSDVLIQCIEDTEIVKTVLECNKILCFSFHQAIDTITLKIYLQKLPLVQFNLKIGHVLKLLFHEFFNIPYTQLEKDCLNGLKDTSDIKSLYTEIRNLHLANQYSTTRADTSLQHEQLIPILRPYQLEAVKWMLNREKKLQLSQTLHPLYVKINLDSDTVIYFAPTTGYLKEEEPLVPSLRTGGILADEMGLGKTLEVLACILNNPCPENNNTAPAEIHSTESEGSESEDDVPLSQLTHTKRTSTQNEYRKKRVKVENISESTPKKKMSETRRITLEWYEKKLQEVQRRPNYNSPQTIPKVQCTCGEASTENTIRCKGCKKRQHFKCTNYEINLGLFYCAQCWQNQPLIKSKATLIVCPPSLIKQWEEEIKKHVKTKPNIFLYLGYSSTPIYPPKLQQFDIVLTTYTVLQNELILINSQATPTLRRPLKYALPGCPIANVYWWRLCLDEAQMVESPDCKVSTMAKCLQADHRWAITGTPITRNIQDLFGLLDYLDIIPYNESVTWNNLLFTPYCSGNTQPMLRFLQQILWRTAKSDVLDQICIPQQTVQEYKLEFSHVEQFYYNREHEHCSSQFLINVSKFEDQTLTLASLNKSTLKSVMTPLLSLRQACVHPHRGRYLGFRKKVTNMAELLEALIAKNKVECEESLRAILASHNGIAGILLLQDKPMLAGEEYRKSFKLAEKYRNLVNVDKLQKIHLLHNLAFILETFGLEDTFIQRESDIESSEHNSIEKETKSEEKQGLVLNVSVLLSECLKVEAQYMERFLQQTQNAFKEAETTSAQVDNLRSEFELNAGIWFSKLMDFIETHQLEHDLIRRVYNQQENFPPNKANGFTSTKKILYSVTIWNDRVYEMQMDIKELLKEMVNNKQEQLIIKPELIESAMNCHIRPAIDDLNTSQKKKKPMCLLCISNAQFKKYESILFNTTKRGTVTKVNEEGEEISNLGNWKPSAEEILLKIIHQTAKGFLKSAPDKICIEDGKKHLQLCFLLRKEFKALRKLWTYYNNQVQAQDEVNMSKMRMQLKSNDEPVKPKKSNILKNLEREINNPLTKIHHLDMHELHYQLQKLELEKSEHTFALNKSLGTQGYLETLKNQQKSGGMMDPCPVCRNALEDEYAILQCGHWYCLQCIDTLTKKCIGQHSMNCSCSVICCVCRHKHQIKTVAYIRSKCLQQKDDGLEVIEGDLSTKIEAIVRLIRDLKKKDTKVKVLVFSAWAAILKILFEGLNLNAVKAELATANADLQKKLPRFKNVESDVNVLLLPLTLGSKGLNIIEATHVVFMEPVLDPGDELQAIGRVHRIGQNKETMVHKFIVQNTIEANIFQEVSSNSGNWDKNKLTVAQLRNLFTETDPTM